MPETTVVTTSDEEPQGEGVLAGAAVAAAALSGAAAAKADDAQQNADEANARARGAQETASDALGLAATSVSAEEARRIAREEYLAMKALDDEAAEEPPTAVVAVDDLPDQVLPRSAQKAEGSEDGKKGSWAQRHGLVS